MDQTKKNEVKNNVSRALSGVYNAFGYKKKNSVLFLEAIKAGLSDHAIKVTITIHSDDNDYED